MNMEVGRNEELTESDVAEISTSTMTVKTTAALQTGLTCGVVINLDSGCVFDVARHREGAIGYVHVVNPKLLIGSPGSRMFHSFNICLGGRTKKKLHK